MELLIIYVNGIILSMTGLFGLDSPGILLGPELLCLSITLIMTMEVLSDILLITTDLIILITGQLIIILIQLMPLELLLLLEEFIINDHFYSFY
jgi:hypothetical protein